jgi:hypothetical protein
VPAEESAAAEGSAAVEPTAVELVVTESPPAAPAMEPEGVQPEVSAVEPVGVELSVPAAQAAAAAPAVEAATTVRLVREVRFPAQPPPPSIRLLLLSLATPPPLSPPKLRCSRGGDISGSGGSDRGVLSIEG